MPPSQDPLYAGLGQAVRIGTELLAALIVGGGLGWVVDTYLLDSNPWGLVVGLGLGAAALRCQPPPTLDPSPRGEGKGLMPQ